MVVDI